MVLVNNAGANRQYLQFHPSSAIVLRLDSSNVVVSSASQESWTMHPAGCSANGYVAGHGPYQDFSDASLKEQIEPAPQGLAEILQLAPKTFVRKPRMEGAPQRQELGHHQEAHHRRQDHERPQDRVDERDGDAIHATREHHAITYGGLAPPLPRVARGGLPS